jgi:hypothetical protein
MHIAEFKKYTEDDYGILAEGEFTPFTVGPFIRAVSDPPDPAHLFLKWKKPETRPRAGLYNYYNNCTGFKPKRCVHVFGVPEALRRDFLVTDLDYPVKIVGLILIVDGEQFGWNQDIWKEKGITLIDDTNRSKIFSGLAWLKKQNLPMVIAAPGFNKSNVENLRMLLGVGPQTAIIPGPPRTEDFEFDNLHVIKTISQLVEQI